MLDWIFEGIVGWVASIVSQLMDAVSGLFLEALGTDMTAMEEYFPFVPKAYDVMQITAWSILILITLWQLFRAFGGPITEAENPWHLVVRGAMFALLIGYAKPIFSICLTIARAPYTALMDITMTASDFTFAGVEQALTNGLTSIIAVASVVGLILVLILEIILGWNYFKLLLETVERYIVVGVLCYTSPLAFSMGASKATNQVFKSWCRMVGSQLLLLVMNVWFLRGFASSMGQYIANGGALTTGKGSIFLWLFCAIAYLKCAQKFDSYLGAIGLNVAQTGAGMGMEMLMAARMIVGVGGGARSAGSMFGRAGNAAGNAATGTGAAAVGFAAGFASRFNPNSYVRDAVVQGGQRMGFGGGAGFVARAFGGIAARNGVTLNSNSISSVATRAPNASGTIAGDIADRSLGNYMPHMQGFQLQGTQISGGHISTTAVSADGKQSAVDMYNAAQYEKPDAPHSMVTAADGSQWYQMASGEGRGAFYDAPVFNGSAADVQQSSGAPAADGSPVEPGGAPSDVSHLETGPAHFEGSPVEPGGVSFDGTPVEPSGAIIDGTPGEPGSAGFDGAPIEPGAPVEPGVAGYEDTQLEPDGAGVTIGTEAPQVSTDSGDVSIPGATVVAGGTEVIDGAAVAGVAAGEDIPEGPQVGGFVGGIPYHGEEPFEGSGGYGSSDAGGYMGGYSEAPLVAATFPSAPEGTALRTVDDGVIEASTPNGGNTLWYNSAYFQEPDAPHTVMQSANGVDWYAMQQHADVPQFETGDAAESYNQATFQSFMPGYGEQVYQVDGSHRQDGHFEVRNEDGSGTRFYDTTRYAAPRGDYQVFEDSQGSQWYAIRGEAAVERRPVYEQGHAVYDGDKLKTETVETVRYKQTPAKYSTPEKRGDIERKPPRRKQ